MKPTLLVLAAGMGSRYGSLKQMDPMGPGGEAIIDYSIYDAIRAGFGKVVFVIRHQFEEDFKKIFSVNRFGGRIEVDYAFQELDYIPYGFQVPKGRTKPWGTNHAVMMGQSCISEPFAVINSDDFYGRDSYMEVAGFLRENEGGKGVYCMIGYKLKNTLSENGSVSRGVCKTDSEGYLQDVVETLGIKKYEDGKVGFDDEGKGGARTELDPECLVSMNIWGFTPEYFDHSSEIFKHFLTANTDNLKAEFYIPYVVNQLIKAGTIRLKVLPCEARWFGVTYKEDRPDVVSKINKLIEEGVYPKYLWA
ncbi:MAG: nucleotidyltransferase [Bacteroidales bacterium]|jgi:dTDP-glucose pyrophosphorylase|nr:nucleotidyltransferase [Bacteroidales bacterium]MCI2121328.1 nucleotidyltransferase [Bacteroidales bacterium]MCI2145921.1 nucleotidyltransferase [Bacteroidales bacterium]